MKVDTAMIGSASAACGRIARDAEAVGFDGAWASESVTDAFLQAQAALLATSRLPVGTAVAVAFARNPMSTAYLAWDLAAASQGRFVLGLGTQVRAHIERRFSMTWSEPVARMRDYLLALRAIFGSWRVGERLDFRGSHYRHTLMTPVFTPAPHAFPIPTMIAAVGCRMTELGAELVDGLLVHTMVTAEYLDNVTLPAVERGLARSGRDRSSLELAAAALLVMGDTEQEMARRMRRAREQIAFYASTPAYRKVLASIGYDALQPELRRLSREGRWGQMVDLVDDTLLHAIAVVGSPEEMPQLCRERFGARLDRISSHFGWPVEDQDRLRALLAAFRAG